MHVGVSRVASRSPPRGHLDKTHDARRSKQDGAKATTLSNLLAQWTPCVGHVPSPWRVNVQSNEDAECQADTFIQGDSQSDGASAASAAAAAAA